MKRLFLMIAIACTAGWQSSIDARAGNVEFNFNAKLEGWTFGTAANPVADSLEWEWRKQSSSAEGAIHVWLGPGLPPSQAVAWAESPCLEIEQEAQKQKEVHVDFSHWTDFPANLRGQVQFAYKRMTDAGWSGWLGVPSADWDPTSGHHMPTAPPSPAPLDTTAPSFVGTTSPFQKHLTSAFTIKWGDFTPNLQNGDEIRFRFLVGVTDPFPVTATSFGPQLVWEINDMTIDGVQVCAVPEPGGLAMAAAAAASGLVVAGRRRLARRAAGS
jgi:hypothetical protein